MKSSLFLFLIFLLGVNIVNAESFGYNNPSLPKLNTAPQTFPNINYSTVNTNNSQFINSYSDTDFWKMFESQTGITGEKSGDFLLSTTKNITSDRYVFPTSQVMITNGTSDWLWLRNLGNTADRSLRVYNLYATNLMELAPNGKFLLGYYPYTDKWITFEDTNSWIEFMVNKTNKGWKFVNGTSFNITHANLDVAQNVTAANLYNKSDIDKNMSLYYLNTNPSGYWNDTNTIYKNVTHNDINFTGNLFSNDLSFSYNGSNHYLGMGIKNPVTLFNLYANNTQQSVLNISGDAYTGTSATNTMFDVYRDYNVADTGVNTANTGFKVYIKDSVVYKIGQYRASKTSKAFDLVLNVNGTHNYTDTGSRALAESNYLFNGQLIRTGNINMSYGASIDNIGASYTISDTVGNHNTNKTVVINNYGFKASVAPNRVTTLAGNITTNSYGALVAISITNPINITKSYGYSAQVDAGNTITSPFAERYLFYGVKSARTGWNQTYGIYLEGDNNYFGGTNTNNTFIGNIKTGGEVWLNTTSPLVFGNGRNATINYDGNNLVFNVSNNGTSGTNSLFWFNSNLSATGYITRTSVYDSSKGSALSYIKDSNEYLQTDSKGLDEINHSAFYGYITYQVTDYSRPVINKIDYQDCNNKLDSNATLVKDEKGDILIECVNKTRTETTYPYTKTEEGVSLDKEIDVLRQAVYELKEKSLDHEFCLSKLCIGIK